MLDAGSLSETALQPRARGTVRVGVALRAGASRLKDLYQHGSAKCLLPHGTAQPEAILLNTAGGITGGDRFSWTGEAGPGAHLTLATQTAERLYRTQPGSTGRVDVRLIAGNGASLDWLAQETILFDGASVERHFDADLAEDARFLAVEPLVLGRAAMGETVSRAHLVDRWRIRRAGRLVWADTLRLSGAVARIAARPACFGPNRAAASVLYAGPDAADRLEAARALLPAEGGASVRDGVMAVRMLARDGQALRAALIRFLTGFRAAALPRVWTM